MQRVYGEFIINETDLEEVVSLIREQEVDLGLNDVPKNFMLRKLGIRVDTDCVVLINGRPFSIDAGEALEFGYDSIKVNSIVFQTVGIKAVVRYMYFREDRVYQ